LHGFGATRSQEVASEGLEHLGFFLCDANDHG
jgi:hypothetical protein